MSCRYPTSNRIFVSHPTFVQPKKILKTCHASSTSLDSKVQRYPEDQNSMLLQSTILPHPPLHHRHRHVSLSLPLSPNSLSFPPGFRTKKHPTVTCSISQVHSYGTVDYERRPVAKQTGLYKSILLMKDRSALAASVLNDYENAGKNITKWELHRIIKELRKFKRFVRALEVPSFGNYFWVLVFVMFSWGEANLGKLGTFMHFQCFETRN